MDTGTAKTAAAGTAVLAALALAACAPGAGSDAAAGRASVVTTIGMITDVVGEVGGGRVVVTGLMGPGVDPHLYKASAGDVRRLAGAELVFFNGLHLEAAMGEVLEELDRWKPTRAVTDRIDRRQLRSPPEFKGNYDPHVWFDVSLWEQTVPVIVAALSELDSAHAAEFAARGAAYSAELRALDAWVRGRVLRLPPERRVLVTAHDAFNYFGRAYGFEVKGLQGISTAAEAGTADVQRLAAEIARRRIPAIFVESSIPRRTVEALQAAVRARGFEVRIGGSLFSDAMGDAGTPEGTYIGMVRHNVNTIVDALSSEVVAGAGSDGTSRSHRATGTGRDGGGGNG